MALVEAFMACPIHPSGIFRKKRRFSAASGSQAAGESRQILPSGKEGCPALTILKQV
jgi:hypothetical protein